MAGISTDVNGMITATVQNVSNSVNNSLVMLTPFANSTAAAVFTAGSSQSLYGWSCGGTGTTVERKYLPGSCRGN